MHSDLDRDGALSEFGLDPACPCIGLFPGSRRNELQRLLPPLLDAAESIHAERLRCNFYFLRLRRSTVQR